MQPSAGGQRWGGTWRRRRRRWPPLSRLLGLTERLSRPALQPSHRVRDASGCSDGRLDAGGTRLRHAAAAVRGRCSPAWLQPPPGQADCRRAAACAPRRRAHTPIYDAARRAMARCRTAMTACGASVADQKSPSGSSDASNALGASHRSCCDSRHAWRRRARRRRSCDHVTLQRAGTERARAPRLLRALARRVMMRCSHAAPCRWSSREERNALRCSSTALEACHAVPRYHAACRAKSCYPGAPPRRAHATSHEPPSSAQPKHPRAWSASIQVRTGHIQQASGAPAPMLRSFAAPMLRSTPGAGAHPREQPPARHRP
jgi:hypothetical protein